MGKLILGVFAGLVISACATPIFPYRFYAMDAALYDGWLRGPKPENDISLEECEPTQSNKAPCMVVKTREYLLLKKEYIDLKIELEACQRDQ